MFPLNQDTFVEYSGNTANDTYSDGFGYIYMMKEGRGRSNSGGSMMFNSQYNNWYFETNLLIEDGTSILLTRNITEINYIIIKCYLFSSSYCME